jgi:hemolysin activation/secretion protein
LSYTGKKADFFGGRNFATVQGVFNVMNGGDDLAEMWNDAEENYWIFRAQMARLQPLFGSSGEGSGSLHNWQLFTKFEGQYTDQNLIPTEKLMLGGYNCLRGYRTRGYVGDYGVYGTFELRTPLLVDGVASLFGDRTDKVAFDRVQFLTFCDLGFSRYNDLPSGFENNEFLVSAGVGMRLAITKYAQIKCDIAFPCADGNNEEDNDMEVYFGAQVQF